jgi:HAD superfamily hydrolase (TIGR01509 family)
LVSLAYSMINGFIFDFDGVLVDSERANIQAAIKTFNHIGKPLTNEEVQSIPGRSSADFIPIFLSKRGMNSLSQHQELYEQNRRNYKLLWNNTVAMFPGGADVIRQLRSLEKKLGIATTNRKETVEMFLKKFNMGGSFSVVVSGEDVIRRKPNAEVYFVAIQKLGLPKNELVAIEDTGIGLQAAKGAGLRCIAIPNKYSAHEDFSGADLVLKSMRDLLTLC